jgi:uncharacterized protein YdhG (YjbR/CyaY superfamily)
MNAVDEYINQFEGEHKAKLMEMRMLLCALMPDAEECISYQMPAFRLHQMVCYYAAFKSHLGFYPTSKPIERFKDLLNSYKHSKGAVQFSLKTPLPEALISEMVQFRLNDIKNKR